MSPSQRLTIASIQPLGTGHEVALAGAPHPGINGVPSDLIERFLGRTFTAAELQAMRAHFVRQDCARLSWLGQEYFLRAAS